jgi:nicotinamidase-related amidase
MRQIAMIILLLLVAACAALAGEEQPRTALLIIDVQEFYFSGEGALVEPEGASRNAARLLERFRSEGREVIHVRHRASNGGEIHENVKPHEGEKVITKESVSCFKDTELLGHLRQSKVERLVICGMMTHMCVEAAARAAHDLGFEVVVVADACATRDLEYNGRTVAARDVHDSTLATLARAYGTVVDTESYLQGE